MRPSLSIARFAPDGRPRLERFEAQDDDNLVGEAGMSDRRSMLTRRRRFDRRSSATSPPPETPHSRLPTSHMPARSTRVALGSSCWGHG